MCTKPAFGTRPVEGPRSRQATEQRRSLKRFWEAKITPLVGTAITPAQSQARPGPSNSLPGSVAKNCIRLAAPQTQVKSSLLTSRNLQPPCQAHVHPQRWKQRSSLRPCAVLQSQAPSPQCLVAKLSLRQEGYQSLLQELLKNYRKKPFSCTSTTITCQPRAISPSWSHDSQPLSRQEKREGHTKQAPRQHEHLPRLTPSWKRPPMNLLAVAQNPSTPTHGMPTAAKKSPSAQISLLKRRGLHPAKRKLHVAADLSTITSKNVKDETPLLTTIAT